MATSPSTDLTDLLGAVSDEVVRHWDVSDDSVSWYGNVSAYLGEDPGDFPADLDSFMARVHPDDREDVRERFLEWVEGGGDLWSERYRFRRGDGEWTTVRERSAATRDDRGGAERVVTSLLDLSRTAGAGSAVRADDRGGEDLGMYRALAKYATDVITVMAPDGTILYESPSLKRVLGFDPEELVGRNAFEFVHPDDRESIQQSWEIGLAEPGTVGVVEYRCLHADGSWRHVESVARRPPPDTEIEGVLIHSRDVTERRELEQRLKETHKLEAVSRLVSGIAHDYNNLLTVITCNTDLLLRDTDESDPRYQEVAEIRDAAHRAGTLTRDLLAFGRQESLRLREIDLVSALQEMEWEIETELPENVSLEMKAEVPRAAVRVDPGLARQVALDVVENAVEAMPEGGNLTIVVRKLEVDEESGLTARGIQPGRWIAVGYVDTGTGMTPTVRERAVEPFFTTKEGRTGLGLSTVYGLVKQTDGELWIESAPGEGTTVWTYLPDADAMDGETESD